MTTEQRGITELSAGSTTVTQVGNVLRPAGHFVLHFVEMCAAMCIGLAVLDLVYVGIARIAGYTDPFTQVLALSTLVIAFNMTVPMVAWMRFRGMAWRPINEMAAAMVGEAVLLLGLYWIGMIPAQNLFPLQHALMMPAMLIPMFFRLDLYTGRAGHGAHAV